MEHAGTSNTLLRTALAYRKHQGLWVAQQAASAQPRAGRAGGSQRPCCSSPRTSSSCCWPGCGLHAPCTSPRSLLAGCWCVTGAAAASPRQQGWPCGCSSWGCCAAAWGAAQGRPEQQLALLLAQRKHLHGSASVRCTELTACEEHVGEATTPPGPHSFCRPPGNPRGGGRRQPCLGGNTPCQSKTSM
jgi:hypothetical protein